MEANYKNKMQIKFNAPITLGFSLVCTAVFVLNIVLLQSIMPFFSISSSIQWSNPFSIVTLATHVIGHASVEHLLGNLTFILLLGPIIEEKYGSSNLFFMILITAFITGVINITFFNTGLMGASGIVFMMILLVSFTNVRSGQIPITFILVALLFIGKELLNSLENNQISEMAHIMGGVCGGVFGFNLSSGRSII